MRWMGVLLCFFTSSSCWAADSSGGDLKRAFEQIRQDYQVPGIALVIAQGGVTQPLSTVFEHYAGRLSTESTGAVGKETYFPVASLTKVFASQLILSLANAGKLSLDDAIAKWLPDASPPAHLTIKDLLSHTLIGESPRPFFYDYRFSWLTRIAEKSTDKPFEQLLTQMLQSTFGTSGIRPYTAQQIASLAVSGSLAIGHKFEGELSPMPHDLGLSASAGLIAKPGALIKAGATLLKDATNASGQQSLSEYAQSRGYANGWFRQSVAGHALLWGYGQYDGYAALWVMVPKRELQLVMLANNNVLSDASRLIFGDVTASPVFNVFASHFLCEATCDDKTSESWASLHRDVYFSRYNETAYHAAYKRLKTQYPDQAAWVTGGNANLLHLSNYLFIVHYHLGYPRPDWQDHQLALLKARRSSAEMQNPYWLFYAGITYDRAGLTADARRSFNALTAIPNMPAHWTVSEAQNWLEQHRAAPD